MCDTLLQPLIKVLTGMLVYPNLCFMGLQQSIIYSEHEWNFCFWCIMIFSHLINFSFLFVYSTVVLWQQITPVYQSIHQQYDVTLLTPLLYLASWKRHKHTLWPHQIIFWVFFLDNLHFLSNTSLLKFELLKTKKITESLYRNSYKE